MYVQYFPMPWSAHFIFLKWFFHLNQYPVIVVVVLDSNSLILKKTDVETLFKIFQDTEENKKLVYVRTLAKILMRLNPFWNKYPD